MDYNIQYTKYTNFHADGIVNQSLNGYLGKDKVYIRFRFEAYWGYWWALDNIKITGSAKTPDVVWTSSSDPDWTSTEQNPTNVFPAETTTYTATYSDPDVECPGIGQVVVKVHTPPEPVITANYCGDSKFIEITTDSNYATYTWQSQGETIQPVADEPWRLEVEIAGTYTVTVTDDFGCSGTGSLNVSDELLTNGDFESGTTGFYTEYTDQTGIPLSLYPEGYYAVDKDAHFYHNNFYGKDHTTGNGNFMIINGHPGSGKVIWRETINNIQPNTNYYFSAWGMNLNPGSPAQLQFRVNGVNTGTIADLSNADKPTSQGQVNTNNWIQFYSNPFWNSGSATQAVLEIVDLNTIRNGNDFGLDDISFGTLEQIKFTIDPQNNSPICSGGTLELYANIEGGREPITYSWTNADGVEVSTEENPVLEGVTAADSGTYTLTVIDGYGCTPQIGTTEVNIIPETKVNAGDDITVCAESPDVELNGTVEGSVTTGFWQKENGDTSGFSNSTSVSTTYTPTADEISAGSIVLVLTSDNPDSPCEPVTDSLTVIFNPTPIIDSIEPVNATCYQVNDGSAKANVSSGTAPYSYLWSDGQTTQTAVNLAPGDYTVIVTDSEGCTTQGSTTIEEPTALKILSTDVTPVSCFGGNDGTASIEVTGGFLAGEDLNYTFTLLDYSGNEISREEKNTTGTLTIENLTAGSYTFTATTVHECATETTTITITQPDQIPVNAGEDITLSQCGITNVQLHADAVDPSLGAGEWAIISPADGGSGSFTDVTSNTSTFVGLPDTAYTLQWTITPVNGCEAISDQVQVTMPPSCSKLDFDGIDDYIDFGNNTDLRNSNGTFTMEAWIKPKSVDGVRTIISKRNLNDLASGGYDLIINNGYPTVRFNNISVVASQKVSTNRWYHIAAVHSGTEISLFVDGIKLKSETTSNKPKIITAPLLVGAMYNPNSPLTPANYFHGWIQEVRLWDTALTAEQLHFIMNQQLKVGTNPVKGSVLPLEVPGNLSWSSLQGYYPLLVSEVNNGITQDKSSAKIDGLLKNIQTNEENTAPLPYISANGGDWKNRNTWDQNVGKAGDKYWEWPNSTGINGDKINWNIAETSHDIFSGGEDITLLGLISHSNTLNMEGNIQKYSGGTVSNGTGNALTITYYLKLDGKIDLNGESQLVQTDINDPETQQTIVSTIDSNSSGFLTRDQQGTASSFNYNYWSSPVLPNGSSTGYKVAEVMFDGTKEKDASYPIPINFGNTYFFADGGLTSPIKISNYWINAFHSVANQYSAWQRIGSQYSLSPGEGYTMKGSAGDKSLSDLQNYTFKGFPNNGTITLSQIKPQQNYLIGNPYPSAISVKEFILDNIKDGNGRNANNLMNGAVYFWDHFGGHTHYLEKYVGGYAVRNILDGVPAISTDSRINATGEKSTKRPGPYIPVAQGFFVNTSIDPSSGTVQNFSTGNLVFKNSQRVFVKESTSSNPDSQFLKPENNTKKAAVKEKTEKIRLDFDSPLGYHRQILVGADKNTTDGFDLGYDAPLNENNLEDMYWVIDSLKYVIQGVPDFNLERVLPLGIKTQDGGEITIHINELENISDDTHIFVLDKADSTYYDLRSLDFKTNIASGEVLDRFEIVFKDNTAVEDPDENDTTDTGSDTDSGTTNPDTNDPESNGNPSSPTEDPGDTSLGIIYLNKDHELAITNPAELVIQKVAVYSLTGQLIQQDENLGNNKQIRVPVREFPSAVYVVKLFTEVGMISKNIIINR